MLKRTVEISREPSHLSVRDGQLLILRKDGPPRPLPAHPPNLAGSIPCEDIAMLLVDEQYTTYSHSALSTLADHGAAVVLCGRDHLPTGLLLPMVEHTEVVWRVDDQVRAGAPLKKRLWQRIVKAKIEGQAAALPPEAGPAREQLRALAAAVKSGDAENHEAQAARVYWGRWLGDHPAAAGFQRDASPGTHASPPNNFLNYGYAVMRAAVARALVGAGLLPVLGIKHRSRSNAFCLADDLVEPLRPLVDVVAREVYLAGAIDLHQQIKARLLLLLTAQVRSGAGVGPLMAGLHRYAASLAECLARGDADAAEALDIPQPLLPVVTDWPQKRAEGEAWI